MNQWSHYDGMLFIGNHLSAEGRAIQVGIDEQVLREEEKLDGCYVIKTDLSAEYADKETVHARYKSLADVEWAFRTMKTGLLNIRKVYVRKAIRTRAHVFTIMLSYMIAYELRRCWQGMELTLEEGISELSSLCAIEVLSDKVSIQTIPEPRDKIKLLLEKANVSLPDSIPCRKVTVSTRKKLVENRKSLIKSNPVTKK